MRTLYENIKSLCEEKGITGAEMCRGIGSSKSLMTNLKLGRTKGITGETAQKIADYFGVTVDRVLGNEVAGQQKKPIPGDGDGLNEAEKGLVKLFRQIPEEKQSQVLESLELALRMQGLL